MKWAMRRTPELVSQAAELRRLGWSYSTIGRRMGLHGNTIRSWLEVDQYLADRQRRNRRRQDLRNKRYGSDTLYRIKCRLKVVNAIARRKGHSPCSSTPEEILRTVTNNCECCGRHESFCGVLCLDHWHIAPGKFRAWLCRDCNRAIGMLQDDPVILRRAADLLEERTNR